MAVRGGAWWRCAWTHHLYGCNDCYVGRYQVLAHFDSVEPRPPFDVLDSAGYQAWRHSLDSGAGPLRSPTSPLHPYAPGSLSSPYSPRPPPAASSSSSSSSSEARSSTTGKRKRDSREEGLEEGEICEEGLPAAAATTEEEEEEEEQRQSKRGRHEKEDEDEDEARQNGGQPASSCLLQ
jgi:hypothetical protein